MTKKNAPYWIDTLGLDRHPEGGWFRRIYESELIVDGTRPAMSSIYSLLESGDFSALLRLKPYEQRHFYSGSPLILHIIAPDGESSKTTLGPDGPFQATVEAGHWFGATAEGAFALVGCTVAPGFEYTDFEMPSRESLLQTFPHHETLIRSLTRT